MKNFMNKKSFDMDEYVNELDRQDMYTNEVMNKIGKKFEKAFEIVWYVSAILAMLGVFNVNLLILVAPILSDFVLGLS